MTRKILVLDEKDSIYNAPFESWGDITNDISRLNDCDLVVFTGGHDVSPQLYGDDMHKSSSCNMDRDDIERQVYTSAFFLEIPMVGICRGAQFLNVMNHGKLIQDVENHGIFGTHGIHMKNGEALPVTSTHHQMMWPNKDYAEVLGWSLGLSPFYETGGKLNPAEFINDISHVRPDGGIEIREPDIVYWAESNSLGVQYHPEYMAQDSRGWLLFQELIKEYLM